MISLAHAQAAAPAGGADYTGLIMMVAMFAIVWLMMIRPQMKRAKEHKTMVEALQKGDEIVTQGGLAGRVTKIGENYLHVDVAESKDGAVEVIVQKTAVANLLPKGTLKGL
ncbi:MAG: preprotein translocase subunit YajC [Azonexus sp.]|jgi:preprotein translocase subunit YajC|nr:preprotein translocase subunit YajC [Betaproteobacteria bacterium]MBK8918822.1 preprotein translocase subunit YajC [Betaproteobacteria bacterium]MBP6034754.1 preprotein translocase subunit YajC [Azonexus sp.]MBP6905294.1 preprotein translocase subunit YajC [Azonexus sp.]